MNLSDHPPGEKVVTNAARLYELRAAVRRRLGERFPEVMREHGEWLRRISKVSGKSVLEVAIQAAAELKAKDQPAAAIVILAAAVEEAEPTSEKGEA